MQDLALLMGVDCVDAPGAEFARLVKHAKTGDTAAFEAIPDLYERKILLSALCLLNGNLEDAKDAAQEVFLRFHRSLPPFSHGYSGDSHPTGKERTVRISGLDLRLGYRLILVLTAQVIE